MRAIRIKILIPGLLVALAAALADEAGKPTSQPAVEKLSYAAPEELCKLANQKIHESSGLAPSRIRKDVFWTHNDSGDAARVYAFDIKGTDLGTFTVEGAAARDWEDMASFTIGKKSYLLLADVGDNSKRRETCELYIVREPALGKKRQAGKASARVAVKITFAYPDGPHDCESVAIDPAGRKIYLATKASALEAKLYELPLPNRTPRKTLTAKAVAKLPIASATAMDFSADGKRAVVLTYGKAHEFTRPGKQTWPQAFAGKSNAIRMPARRQGESICYGIDSKTLYLTSELLPTPLWKVPIREEKK